MNHIARILIVTDHPAVRTDLRTILDFADGIAVAGEAANSNDAIRQAQALSPDIVLVDLEMPGREGYRITEMIKSLRLPLAVAALTAHDYPAARERAAHSGADAIIIKGSGLHALEETIHALLNKFQKGSPASQNGPLFPD